MRRHSASPAIGAPATSNRATWVQTERKAHEAWAWLSMRKPRAAALMHHLVAKMGHQNAVVVSQKTLAKLMGCHLETVKRAITDLVAERWIQVVQLNGPGTVCAYVVNSRVAWGQSRDELRLSMFSAVVVADAEDQDPAALDNTELRRIPMLFPGEQQLSAGPGLDPPSQPVLEGFESDLPALDERES